MFNFTTNPTIMCSNLPTIPLLSGHIYQQLFFDVHNHQFSGVHTFSKPFKLNFN